MKKNIFCASILLLLCVQTLMACDICGCSSGNYFLAPMPQFNKHFVGMRYSLRSFETILKDDKTQFSNDIYQTTEIWGGFKIKNRIQILGFIPYNFNHSKSDDGVKNNSGIGDATIFFNYILLDKNSISKKKKSINQQWLIGAGIKIPTGKFLIDTSEIISSANNQLGSGSIDFVTTSTYSIRFEKWGLNANATYKINQAASDFRFGNRFTTSLFLFHPFALKNVSLNPNIGLQFEKLAANKLYTETVEQSGGSVLLGTIGVETKLKNFAIGMNMQLPIVSNFADGQTKVIARGMVHVTYTF